MRVSAVGGRGGDSFHADRDQVTAVEQYAARHGASVVFMEPELSVSGGLPIEDRPALRSAIEGVERGEFDGIVCAYLSRLTRSRSGQEIWDRVEAVGGHVHCAAENLDTSTPNGRFIRDIHLANAVREREERGEGFELQREQATAAGVWQRRQIPKGYVKNPKTRRLEPGPDADDVRKAFADKLAGVPVIEIARNLKMTTAGARYLLKNRVYLGELKVGRHVNEEAHPALVDVETFEDVQSSPAPRPPRGKSGSAALLAGLVRCRACGHVMVRSDGNYVCRRMKGGARICPAPATLTCAKLDAYVEAIVRHRLESVDVDSSDRTDEVEERRAALDLALRRRRTFLAAFGDDEDDEDALAEAEARKRAVDDARTALRRAEAEARATTPLPTGRAREVYEGLTRKERQEVLRGMLTAVVVRSSREIGGPGSRSLGQRVRVLSIGANLDLPRPQGNKPMPMIDIPWPKSSSEHVLRMPGS